MDYSAVKALIAPTPERVATAKAWISERRRDSPEWGPEGSDSEFAAEQGESGPPSVDSRDPANQDGLIRWCQWVNAFRYAVYDFEQAGLLIPILQDRPDSPAPPGWGFSIRVLEVPLGNPGGNVQPSTFPTVLLYARYGWSLMGEAERAHRLELYDADLYITRARLDEFDVRARRCVEEALACYRNDLFLAAANMLGAASEAVWHQLADAVVAAGLSGQHLREELERPLPSIALIQRHLLEDLRVLSPADFSARFGLQRSVVGSLGEVARYWRDVRNYGMHPGGALAPETYSQASVGVLLMGATGYFEKLSRLLTGLRACDSV